MIAWKDGKVDRDALIRMVHPDGSSNNSATSKDDLADALDECVWALLRMRSVYVTAPADDAARLLMLVRDECLRKIGVEP